MTQAVAGNGICGSPGVMEDERLHSAFDRVDAALARIETALARRRSAGPAPASDELVALQDRHAALRSVVEASVRELDMLLDAARNGETA